MSSTSRGGKRSDAELYETPAWVVKSLLRTCPLPAGLWLEPAAGTGAIIKVVNESFPETALWWHVVEAQDSIFKKLISDPALSRCVTSGVQGDYRTWEATTKYKVIITNPPFSLAFEFAQKAMGELANRGKLALLQRLNWIGGKERNAWMRMHPPDIYVLPNRIAFKPGAGYAPKRQKHQTDSIEYAWFVWEKSSLLPGKAGHGSYTLLPALPKEERK